MKGFLIGALVFGALCLSGSAAEDEIILTIGDGVTWETVFDAGFRPTHLSDEIYMCRQYDVNLSIKNSGSSVLNLGRGDVDFSVKQDGLLVLISFYGRENSTVQEAKKKTKLFADIFKNDLIRKADFKTFTTTHKVDYSGKIIDPAKEEEHVDLKTASNAARVGDFSVIYRFSDSYRDDFPLVERFSILLKSKEAKKSRPREQKIQPPEGYEHISLDPVLDSAKPDENRGGLPDGVQGVGRKKEEPADPDTQEASDPKTSPIPWWVLVIGIVLIGIVAIGGVGGILVRSRMRRDR